MTNIIQFFPNKQKKPIKFRRIIDALVVTSNSDNQDARLAKLLAAVSSADYKVVKSTKSRVIKNYHIYKNGNLIAIGDWSRQLYSLKKEGFTVVRAIYNNTSNL